MFKISKQKPDDLMAQKQVVILLKVTTVQEPWYHITKFAAENQ